MAASLGAPGRKPRPAERGVRLRLLRSGRFRHRGAAAPSRDLYREGDPGGPRKLNPNRTPGPPAYLPRLGNGSARGHGRRAPADRPGRTKALWGGNAPSFPAALSGAGSPAPRRGGPARLPDAGPGQRAGPGCLSSGAPRPERAFHPQVLQPPCERARLHSSRLASPLGPSETSPGPEEAEATPTLLSRSPRAAPARRHAPAGLSGRQGRGGAGRRLGGPEPSLQTEGARLRSPAQRTHHPRS